MSTAQTMHSYRVTYAQKTALTQNGHGRKHETLRIKARHEDEAKNNAAHHLGEHYAILSAERLDKNTHTFF